MTQTNPINIERMKGKGFSKGIEGTVMRDGSQAWLTPSGRYFCRAEPSYEKQEKIAYYSLEKERILLAMAQCGVCSEMVESRMCGDFRSCGCGKTMVDTDRSFRERHRYIGEAKPLIKQSHVTNS